MHYKLILETSAQFFLVTWLITSFEPLQQLFRYILKRKCCLDSEHPCSLKHRFGRILRESIYNILSCHKCLSLWLTLLCCAGTNAFTLQESAFIAILVSFLAYTYQRIINSLKTYI